MTYYEQEVKRIKELLYSNQKQLETVIGARNFIRKNFNKDLNLNMLSNYWFTSKYHLLRLFKRYYGQTPKQYHIEIRIEKAKDLLRAGKKVKETCFEVGFESVGSFCNLFKLKVGKTPGEYQKEQLSIREEKI